MRSKTRAATLDDGKPKAPTNRILSLRFIPLDAVAAQCYDPAGGCDGQRKSSTSFTYDAESRTIVSKYLMANPTAVAKLPSGYDAVLINTDEPTVNIYQWVIGKSKDCAELRKAVDAFVAAKDRLLELLGSGPED